MRERSGGSGGRLSESVIYSKASFAVLQFQTAYLSQFCMRCASVECSRQRCHHTVEWFLYVASLFVRVCVPMACLDVRFSLVSHIENTIPRKSVYQ